MPILAALALLSPSALALECPQGPYAANVDLSRPVPLDARFAVEHPVVAPDTDLKLALTGPRGVKVPLEPTRRGPSWAILKPAAPLLPHSLYQLADADGNVDVKFRTSATTDTDTPNAPLVQSVERELQESRFGTNDRVVVVIDPRSDAHHWELHMGRDLTFADPIIVISTRPTITAGTGRCGSNAPAYSTHTDYYLRVRAVDAGGNHSEWAMLPMARAVQAAPGPPTP
jgi:hypothetical protein